MTTRSFVVRRLSTWIVLLTLSTWSLACGGASARSRTPISLADIQSAYDARYSCARQEVREALQGTLLDVMGSWRDYKDEWDLAPDVDWYSNPKLEGEERETSSRSSLEGHFSAPVSLFQSPRSGRELDKWVERKRSEAGPPRRRTRPNPQRTRKARTKPREPKPDRDKMRPKDDTTLMVFAELIGPSDRLELRLNPRLIDANGEYPEPGTPLPPWATQSLEEIHVRLYRRLPHCIASGDPRDLDSERGTPSAEKVEADSSAEPTIVDPFAPES